MPIILMVEDNEIEQWQTIFDIINMSNPEEKQVNNSLSAHEHATIWDSLADADMRDNAFVDKILKDNAIVLENIDEVKTVLMSHLSSDPYRCIGHPKLGSVLDGLVRDKYLKGKYSLAMERIDNMDAESVKNYLKDMIKTNVAVGIQIIKNK